MEKDDAFTIGDRLSLFGMVYVMAAFTDFVVHAGACEQ